jgi:hypothetical protein
MKLKLHKNRDFWGGLMLIGFGAGAMFIARDYPFGSARRMGPGFFPIILGGILVAFGICLMGAGLYSKEEIKEHVSPRAMIVLPLSMILFAILMQLTGLIPALASLVFVSAASGREFKLVEVLLMTVILTVASVAIFVWGLGLPFPLIKGF